MALSIRLALLASLVLLAALVLAAPLNQALERRQTTCFSGVYMIAARGSDEDPGEGVLKEVTDAVIAQLPNSDSIAVDYPASMFFPPYDDSVNVGINDTMSKIKSYVDACGSASKIALLGYSQGGNIMTDVLAGNTDAPGPIDKSLSQYITAVTVFGDPTFVHGQSFDQGNATTDGWMPRAEGSADLALLNTYAPILQSYCTDRDLICASGDEEIVHDAEVDIYKTVATNFIVSKNS